MGFCSLLARSNASAPHGYQSTGLFACWRRYGLVSPLSRLAILCFYMLYICYILLVAGDRRARLEQRAREDQAEADVQPEDQRDDRRLQADRAPAQHAGEGEGDGEPDGGDGDPEAELPLEEEGDPAGGERGGDDGGGDGRLHAVVAPHQEAAGAERDHDEAERPVGGTHSDTITRQARLATAAAGNTVSGCAGWSSPGCFAAAAHRRETAATAATRTTRCAARRRRRWRSPTRGGCTCPIRRRSRTSTTRRRRGRTGRCRTAAGRGAPSTRPSRASRGCTTSSTAGSSSSTTAAASARRTTMPS